MYIHVLLAIYTPKSLHPLFSQYRSHFLTNQANSEANFPLSTAYFQHPKEPFPSDETAIVSE